MTTDLPNSDIRAKHYGQNIETMHREAKNLVVGAASRKYQDAALKHKNFKVGALVNEVYKGKLKGF